MSPKTRNWVLRIQDILEALGNIEDFIKGYSFEQFKTDRKTFYAVVCNLEIIGEAAGHVPPEIQDKHPEIPWKVMKGFRNVLAHVYFGVDEKIVWDTMQNNLIPLKPHLQALSRQTP